MNEPSDFLVARRGDGLKLDPGDGTVPVLKELSPGRLLTIGTACYVTRYGLFLTAGHVITDLCEASGELGTAFVLHLAPGRNMHLRQIKAATLSTTADIALGQAENFLEKYPQDPLVNLRASLTITAPPIGSSVVTYAYPENRVMDFTKSDAPKEVRGDFFSGKFLRSVELSENPFIPYPHYETSIQLKSGSSGGPVFDERGRLIGVNCRGWDFGDNYEGEHLSSIVPVRHLVSMDVAYPQIPSGSWEEAQLPEHRRRGTLRVEELMAYGHIALQP